MFGVKDNSSARACSENDHELKRLLPYDKGDTTNHTKTAHREDDEELKNDSGKTPHVTSQDETVVITDKQVRNPNNDKSLSVPCKDSNPSNAEEQSATATDGTCNGNLSNRNAEQVECDEIVMAGDIYTIIGCGVDRPRDSDEENEEDDNVSHADETNDESTGNHSDCDEPTYPYDEPEDFENAVHPSQNPKKVRCFGRSNSLRKKFDDLLFMIRYNHKDRVEELMDGESERNQAQLFVLRDEDGLPCLIRAVTRQSLDCLRPLFERFKKLQDVFVRNGINMIDAVKSRDKKSLFHFGAEVVTHSDIIKALQMCHLKEEVADIADCNGSTPLIVACRRKNREMTEFLVSCNAKIDRVDKQGDSPIYLAAVNGCSEILKVLLTYGMRESENNESLVSNNKLYRKKGTILQAIIESKSVDTFRVCRENTLLLAFDLIRKCLRLELKNDQHFLHKVCKTPLVDLVTMAVQENALLLKGTDETGMTPLMWAAEEGQFDVVRLILHNNVGQQTVSVARSEDKRTALMIACIKGYHKIAKLIMEESVVRLSDQDWYKRNVFHHSAKRYEVLKVLIEVCLKRDVYRNYQEFLQTRDYSGCVSLHLAAASGSHKNVKLILENGVPYNIRTTPVGKFALHYAACKTLPTVKTLVEFVEYNHGVGAMKELIDSVDNRQVTSLHLAAALKKWRTVSYLLDKGATIKCDYEKETPLHFASASGCTKTVECLIQNNPSVIEQENRVGETAAMFAAVEGRTEVLQHLFKYRIQLWGSSNGYEKQKTCLDWAVLCKRSETATAILDHDSWKEAMKKSSEGADGLLAEMVKNMPGVALKVLDKCFTESSDGAQEYDFFPLQTVKGIQPKEIFLSQMGLSNKSRVVSMQALESMVKLSRDECLHHVVVQKFLSEKWRRRIRQWYLFALILYTVFLVALTMYIGFVTKGNYSSNEPCVIFAWGICAGFAGLSIIKEFFQLLHKKLDYFGDFTTYMELVMYICVFIFLPYSKKSNLQWQAGAIAIFLGWINFIWFLKRFPAYGIYIIMVKKIFVTFLKVFVPVGFFIMAFAMTFFVLLQNDEAKGFETIPRALVTSFAMMVGEINYRENFLEQTGTNFVLIMVFVVIFLVVMTILLMNLLTGLAVGDTGKILRRSMAEKRLQRAQLIVDMEKSLNKYPYLGAKFMEPVKKFPKRKSGFSRVIRKLKEVLSPNLDDDKKTSECPCTRLKEQLSEMKTTMEDVQKSLMQIKQDMSIKKNK